MAALFRTFAHPQLYGKIFSPILDLTFLMTVFK
jgi:hypothetical protein